MNTSLQVIYKAILLKLKALYPELEARAMADRLLEHYLDCSPSKRIISGSTLISLEKISAIEAAVDKLLKNVPLQYIIGRAFFMELVFEVNSSVLIPRPETEELVSYILKEFNERKKESNLQILDIGTGSGCIAISLKHYFKESKVTAIDISEEALSLAVSNAKLNKAEVKFIQFDILDQNQWKNLPQFDLIVSNPPYVTVADKQQMLPNVIDYEPHMALFVPDYDPLIFYRNILSFAKTHLNSDGILWFEINEMFGNELKELASAQGFDDINIIFDFHGKSRFLHCIKK